MIVKCRACGSSNRVPPGRAHQTAKCGKCKQPLGPIDAPIAIRSEEEFRNLTAQASLPVLVDYWAAWCGPCRAIAPELEKLAQRQRGRLLVAKVDTEGLPAVAAAAQIRSIPTLALYRGGAEVKRVSGAMSASALEQAFAL